MIELLSQENRKKIIDMLGSSCADEELRDFVECYWYDENIENDYSYEFVLNNFEMFEDDIVEGFIDSFKDL